MGKEPFVQKDDVTDKLDMRLPAKLAAFFWHIACAREAKNPSIALSTLVGIVCHFRGPIMLVHYE